MADLEALTLDSLPLNDMVTLMLVEGSLSMTPPAKRLQWVGGADSDGDLLADEGHYENRVIECQVQIMQQATRDLTNAKIGLLLDKLQEAGRNSNGLPLVWTPANSTLSTTFRCLAGEITGLPVDWQSGYLARAPTLNVRLTCKPFGEGTEVSLGTVTSSDPLVTLEVTGVAGDVPALGRLVVTDAASQARRWAAWGLESRWYPTSSPPSLLIDSTSLVTTGYAGVTATRSGAYSGASNNVISATLRTQVQAICGLGDLTHVGAFRPQLRFYASALTMGVRLTYQTLDGPFRSLSYYVPVAVGWNHVDLGLVTIPTAVLGTQRWAGRIEAVSTATGGETFQVDFLGLMPAEAFGRTRASYAYVSGVLAAFDDFDSATALSNLGGRTATTGGTWASSGAGGDLIATTPPDATSSQGMYRDDNAALRLAVLGSTNYADVESGVAFLRRSAQPTAANELTAALLLRYVDASNMLRVVDDGYTLSVVKVIAGASTVLAQAPTSFARDSYMRLRAVAFATGRGFAQLLSTGGAVLVNLAFTDGDLATGGTLQTGKFGFADGNTGADAHFRYYDDFYAAVPPPEPIVCHSGQSIEFRHDTTLREDATGTYAGPPPEYVGARFLVPNAGGPVRKARIAVMARRGDVESVADDYIADSTTVAAYATPRYLVVPR